MSAAVQTLRKIHCPKATAIRAGLFSMFSFVILQFFVLLSFVCNQVLFLYCNQDSAPVSTCQDDSGAVQVTTVRLLLEDGGVLRHPASGSACALGHRPGCCGIDSPRCMCQKCTVFWFGVSYQ